MILKEKKKTWVIWLIAAVCVCLLGAAVLVLWLPKMEAQAPTEPSVAAETPPTESEEPPTEPPFTYPQLDLPENPYGERDFDYLDRYLTCTAGPCLLGVDVSYWQYDVVWPLVKASGMDFAMIRFAWRGSTEGGMEEDSYARINYEKAKAAGLLVGGYFFSQAITPEEAVEEAEFVLEMTKDMELDMPIVFDWEQTGGRTADMDPRTLTDCAKAFCETIEAGGREAMVYFNVYYACFGMYLEELTDYGFWLAMYDSRMDFPYKIDMWQHTDHGSVPGIEGPVDVNIYFLPEDWVPPEEPTEPAETVAEEPEATEETLAEETTATEETPAGQ